MESNNKLLAGKKISKNSFNVFKFISILLILPFFFGNVSAISKSQSDCRPGYLFCDYYGCIESPFCPEACENLKTEFLCGNTRGENKCSWDGKGCSRDVKCSTDALTCASTDSNCRYCGAFKCLPKSYAECPQSCELYTDENKCKGAPNVGPLSCAWSDGRCSFNDKEKSSTSIPDKATPTPTSSSKETDNSTKTNESKSQPSPTSKDDEKDLDKDNGKGPKTDPGKKSDANSNDKNDPSKTRKPTSTPTETDDPNFGNTSTGVSRSGAIGIGVGVSLGLIGLAGILMLIWHRRKERMKTQVTNTNMGRHNTMYRPQSFLKAVKSVVNDNQRQFDAAEPLSPLPPAVNRS
ncbi:hypothetical protein K502DRAFT_322503 [Neoconidiobolus thromboides FSU 785]|nr:hypothetical protein K502DRAFT_322503 [Neoconidiobolus thromboides FSU 785]